MALSIDFIVNDKATSEIKRLQAQLKQLKPVINDTDKGFLGLNKSLTNLAVGFIGFQAVKNVTTSFIKQADAAKLLNSQLKLVTKSSAELYIVERQLFDLAQETRQDLSATVNLYARLARASKSLGTTQTDLLVVTESINKALIISGASTQEASSAITQLSQGLASGVLRGEEFNSITENGSRIAQALSDSLGVTTGELRAMAKEGKLTSEVVMGALISQSEKLNEEFGLMAPTVGQMATTVGNSFIKLSEAFDKTTQSSDFMVASLSFVNRVLEGIQFRFEGVSNEFGDYRKQVLKDIKAQQAFIDSMKKNIDSKEKIVGLTKEQIKLKTLENNALNASAAALENYNNQLQQTQDDYIAIVGSDYDKWLLDTNNKLIDLAETGSLTAEELQKVYDVLKQDFDTKSFGKNFEGNLTKEIESAFSNVRDFDDFAEAFGSAVSSALANSVSSSVGEALGGGVLGALGGGIVGAGVGIVFNELLNSQDAAEEAKRIRDEKLQASVDGLKDATERLYAQVFGAGTGIQQVLTKDMAKTFAEFSDVQKELADTEKLTEGLTGGMLEHVRTMFDVPELETELNNLAIEIKNFTSELVDSIDAIAGFSDKFGDLSDELSGTTVQADIRGEKALAETYALLGISSEAEFQAKLDELVKVTEFRDAEAIKEGLTADVDSKEYQDALDAVSGLSEPVIDAINNYDTLATAVDFLNKAEAERITILSETQKAVNDAMLGSLSYLTDIEKLSYANNIFQSAITPEDRITSSRQIAELSQGTTRTKEEFIPAFSQFINELEKQAEEATTQDVVDKLDEVIVQLESNADSATGDLIYA